MHFFLSLLVPFIIVPIPLSNFCCTWPGPSSNHHPGEVQTSSLLQTQRWWWKTCSEWVQRSCSWLIVQRPLLSEQHLTSHSALLQWCPDEHESRVGGIPQFSQSFLCRSWRIPPALVVSAFWSCIGFKKPYLGIIMGGMSEKQAVKAEGQLSEYDAKQVIREQLG